MAERKKLSGKQLAFVHQYIRLGGRNATAAAVAAGYGKGAHVSAHRLLHYPYILEAIREETERRLRAQVALGADILEDLAKNAQSESVRLQAAQALLDRGGLQLASVSRSEHRHIIEDRRTDAELLERAQSLARELGISGRVIDGQIVPDKADAAAPAEDPACVPLATPRQGVPQGTAALSELPANTIDITPAAQNPAVGVANVGCKADE